MIYCPTKYYKDFKNYHEELKLIRGELDDKQAKITLAKFLRQNLGFTCELVSGFRPAMYQEMMLKAMFNRNFSMFVACRGGSKSTVAALACFLLPIFHQGTHILLAAPTFRTSRHIFTNLEKIVKSPEAQMLQECFSETASRLADLFEWNINGGSIRAIPLNGEKIRGFRANTLVLDEFLLLSEDIVNNVLMPFLIAPSDIKKRMEIVEREDKLVLEGKITNEQRTQFPNSSRMIALTSASYTFENAYKVYSDWHNKIMSDEPIKDGKDGNYFVCNISWEALPQYMVEQSVIEEAQNGGIENAAFLREYGARFVDGSDSYFSAKKMHEQTIVDGQKPNVLIQGNPSKKYILSIDPSWSSSPSSDYFAMCVGEINEEAESITIVHNYAVAGSELKEHIKYYFYLLNAFNIEIVVADNSDGNFIKAANESTLFQDNKLHISEFEYDGDLINQDYSDMIRKAKRDYSKMSNKICFKRAFSSETNRRMNEQLQFFINTKRVWFGSRITPNEDEYDKAIKLKIPYDPTNKNGDWQDDLISTQDSLINEVKKQCSLIEVGSSPLGKQTFDLPQSLKRNRSAGRARKDNYTTLLLVCEGFRAYQDIMKQPAQEAVGLFMPRMVGRSTLG